MEPGRCSIHGLILAEDGKCVICRRGMSATSADEPRKTISDPMWAVIIGGVVLVGAGAWLVIADPFSAKPRKANDPVVLVTKPPPQPEVVDVPAPKKPTVFVSLDPPVDPSASSSAAPSDPEPTGPTEADVQAAMRQVRITMYSSGTDAFCEQVRTFLRKRKYTFTDFDIDKSETDRIQMRALDPSGTVPTLDIEGTVLVGFDRQEFESTVRRIAEAKLAQRKN